MTTAKRAELVRLCDGIPLASGAQSRLVEAVVDAFCTITPPEYSTSMAPLRMELIVMRSGGVGGATSRKAGNIVLSWRRLIVDLSESTLAALGVAQVPWTAPLAGLIIWNKMWALLDTNIEEEDAIVLWALWTLRTPDNLVAIAKLPSRVNDVVSRFNHPGVTPARLQRSLTTLRRLRCIEDSSDGASLWLREWVRVKWD